MSLFLASLGFGLVTAAVLAIAAVGFTMQFAVTDVLNLAYGAVMIASAFVAYALNQAGVNVWIAMLAAAAAGAAGTVLHNRGIYTPFQRRGSAPIAIVIVSLGLTLILECGLQAIVGGNNVSYRVSQGPTLHVGGLTLTAVQLVIIGLSVVVMLAVHGLLRYTKLGKAMRATAANRSLARNCGIRTDRVVTATWALTGVLCGIAGTVLAMNDGSFGATSADLFLVVILAAVFLGGPGQAYGAMAGAVIIGLATEISAAYIGGWNLPWPVPWIGAMIAGGLVALPFTFLVGRRLRGDFAAVGLLVTAVMANLLVNNYRPALNGSAGLSLVPSPLQGRYNPQSQGYQWLYAAVTLVLAVAVYLLVRRVTESPYGRSLRAMRDNDVVADSLGKNLLSMRAAVLVLGGMLAGLSGAILVGFINLWAPSAWGYAETIVLFAAVIIGGAGSHRGAVLGAILVPVGFEEATRYIPQFGPPGLVQDLQWVAIGLLIVIFLWFRPQGVLPERRRRTESGGPSLDMPNGDVVTLASAARAPGLADASRPGGSAVRAGGPLGTRSAPSTAPPDGDPLLRTVDVTRDFGGVHAVAGVSIEVRRGTLTGLIGPNGAGKSTLLAMLAGTIPVTAGQVIYAGTDVTGVPAFRRARLGLVRTFQLASEFKRLTG